MADLKKIALDVIDNEIRGLNALKEGLDEEFLKSLGLLSQANGRIIVTGMGKSGHVARKIAATFSSTGTPALYVHPGEASHGDLGMITPDDVMLVLSKSGETPELGDCLGYAKRFSIPVIAMTAKRQSTLGDAAAVSLILPDIAEACSTTFAPTTSTTMMMALGDALAISLLRNKGVTATQFQGFHPGGMLGAALRRVADLMHPQGDIANPLPLCSQEDTLAEAIVVMTKGGFGCVGLLNTTGELTGILTDGDVRRLYGNPDAKGQVKDVMTRSPKTVTPDTIAGDALALMSIDKITSLFVVENRKPVGLLHIHDCLASGVV